MARTIHPPKKTKTQVKLLQQRLLLVWMLICGGLLLLGVRLVFLQVINAKSLQAKAKNQQVSKISPLVPRRAIVDRMDKFLAIDQPSYSLYAHPKLFNKNPAEIAHLLAPILNQPKAELLAKFQKQKSGIKLAYGLTNDRRDRIRILRIDGLDLAQEAQGYTRIYPQNETVAEVLGYLDLEHQPQAGIEYSQSKLLERKVNQFAITSTAKGGLLPDHVTEELIHRDDLKLKLTVDLILQRAAREALKEQIQKWKAKRGTVIVMDANTGSILAMVVEPTFDPNRYSDYAKTGYKNWAVADLYEPGSTFKPINVAIALETGIIQPDTTVNDPGSVVVETHTIRNSDKKGHGKIGLAEILQHSSNVGMVAIMEKLAPVTYHNWLERLEIGQKTGIDLPFEARGNIKPLKQFIRSKIEPATTSFGQGLNLTPIQLVTLTAALANGGKLVTPHLVEGLFDGSGNRVDRSTLPPPRQIFQPKNTEAVIEMMETVVNTGTGANAKIDGYRIAGKTGTSQKAGLRGGYDPHARITSFVGILPVNSDRRYVVFAAVDEPKGEAYGGTVAAPIVQLVMKSLITLERIPPTVNSSVDSETVSKH